MKVHLRNEEGLIISLEQEDDWEIFTLLLRDVAGRGDDWLAKQMGLFVDNDEWDELVVPELSKHYNSQVATVAREVAQARKRATNGVGEILLNQLNGEAWYGVLNQARLGLEGRWKLAAAEEAGEFEGDRDQDFEKTSAYFRSRLYCFFQAQLIEFVLD